MIKNNRKRLCKVQNNHSENTNNFVDVITA